MDKRIFGILIALLFFGNLVQGQFYILDKQTIEINVDKEGNAMVTEKYFMVFQSEEQLIEFRQTVSGIGASVNGWRDYDKRIYPKIGQEKDITVSGIAFIENATENDYLEISYALNQPLMEKQLETSRVIDYKLKTRFFNEFVQGSLWVIPQRTLISISLPKGVEINRFVKPDATISENTIVWGGYVFGNEMNLEYSVFKQIASFNLNQTIREMMQSDMFWLFAATAAIALFALFVKRKAIAGRVETYIEKHSSFVDSED